MVRSLKIILWDEEIGRLAWDERRRTSYFMFNPDFTKKGLNIAPLVAPINGVRNLMPVWGNEAKLYQKLPSFLADALPDAWGSQLFDLWRQQNHLSNSDITPLDKLSFIGKRGMGALEFIPEITHDGKIGKIDIKSLVDLSERIFKERENVHILPEESITMQSLLTVGTSAGGRQPKAIIAINRKTGEVRSGQVGGNADYDYYILKFGDPQCCSAELEMTYYDLATAAGINMMQSELFPVEGGNHFLTKRFDRKEGKKLHTQTLAAIEPETKSYEQLISVCRKLHLPEADCQEVFRRMVFNILANNTDDHVKNFSFIMDEKGNWRLSPAYDITYIINVGGFLPDEDHCLYIRAKLRNITRDDVIQFAKDNGIRRPDETIREVANSLKAFKTVAIKYGVTSKWIGRVETTLKKHLIDWGELECQDNTFSFDYNGHIVSNIRVEQTYKGNYHLYADIDGRERKFIISRTKPEFSMIDNHGHANLTDEQLKVLAIRFLLKL